MENVKQIQKELVNVVKQIPIQQVLLKLFGDMEFKKEKSTAKIKVYKNANFIAFCFLDTNTVAVKFANGDLYFSGDTIGLVERTKYWDYWDVDIKDYKSRKEYFKKSVLWLAKEFGLIKDIKDGEIKINYKQLMQLQMQREAEREEILHKIEIVEQKAKMEIERFKAIESIAVDKDIRGISKDLINLIAKQDDNFKIVRNKDKGNRLEFKVALKDYKEEIDGIQTIYYNIYSKKWDKINAGRANVAYFGNKNAENLVVTESFFDSLSAVEILAELQKKDYKDILQDYFFVNTGGQYSNLKKQTIQSFLRQNNFKQIILAHDNDRMGENYDNLYVNGDFKEFVKDKKLVIFKAKHYKDLNDLLKNNSKIEKEMLVIRDVTNWGEERELTNNSEHTTNKQPLQQQQNITNTYIPFQNVVTKNTNISDILSKLQQQNTNNKMFYKIEDNLIKIAKFKAKEQKLNGVFFKEDFITINTKGQEKGAGVAILFGKNINNIKNIQNIVFCNNILSGLKILLAANKDIENSVIFAVKSATVEAGKIFNNFLEMISKYADNYYVVTNNKNTGEFLEELAKGNFYLIGKKVIGVKEEQLRDRT